MGRERKPTSFFFAFVLLVVSRMAIHGQGRRLLQENHGVENSMQSIEGTRGGIGPLANGPSPKGPGHQSPTPPPLDQSISFSSGTKLDSHKEKSMHGIEKAKGDIGPLANGPSPKGPSHQSPAPPPRGRSISFTMGTELDHHNKEKSMYGIEKSKGDIGLLANGPSPKGPGHQSPAPPPRDRRISFMTATELDSHNKKKWMQGIEKAKGNIGLLANGPSPKGPGHQSPAPPPLRQNISFTSGTKLDSHHKEKSMYGIEKAKGDIGLLANGPSPKGPGHQSPAPPPLSWSISSTSNMKVASHNKEKSSHGLEEVKGDIGPLANGPSPRGPGHESPTPPPLVQSISLTSDTEVASHKKEKSMHGTEEAKGAIGPLANGPSPKGPGHEHPTPPPLGGKP